MLQDVDLRVKNHTFTTNRWECYKDYRKSPRLSILTCNAPEQADNTTTRKSNMETSVNLKRCCQFCREKALRKVSMFFSRLIHFFLHNSNHGLQGKLFHGLMVHGLIVNEYK